MLPTTNCPRCGLVIDLQPKLGNPTRLEGRCACWPLGPVIELDAVGPYPEGIITIDTRDGIDASEASAAARALNRRKHQE